MSFLASKENLQAATIFSSLANSVEQFGKKLGFDFLKEATLPLFGDSLKLKGNEDEAAKKATITELVTALRGLSKKAASDPSYTLEPVTGKTNNLRTDLQGLGEFGPDGKNDYQFKWEHMFAEAKEKIATSEKTGDGFLKFDAAGEVKAKLKLDFVVNFGRDDKGFFLNTSKGKEPYLGFGAAASLEGSELAATVGFLKVKAKDNTSKAGQPDDAYIKAKLTFNDPNKDEDNKLRDVEITRDAIWEGLKPKIEAGVDVNLGLSGGFTPPGNNATPEAKTAFKFLPEIKTDFKFKWTLTQPIAAELPKPKLHHLKFDNVKLMLGSALGPDSVIGQAIKPIGEVASIVAPVTGILTKEIAPLKAVGAPPTLLALVGASEETVQGVKAINSMADTLSTISKIATKGYVDLGSHTLLGGEELLKDPSKYKGTNNPNYKPTPQGLKPSEAKDFNSLPAKGSGFSFPILDDPLTALGLLTGKDVDLVAYKLPQIALDLKFSKSFPLPVPIPVPVILKLGGGVGFTADLGFGFDTRGLKDWMSKDFAGKDAGLILNGLYISDNLVEGKDLPEVEVKGELTVSAGVDIGLLAAYVGGGLGASVALDLRDPDGDGKFRLGEIASNFDNGLGDFLTKSFEFKGKISAFAFVDVRALWWDKRFELGRVTLLEFPAFDEEKAKSDPHGAFTRGVGSKQQVVDQNKNTYDKSIILNVGGGEFGRRGKYSRVPLDLGPDETITIWNDETDTNPDLATPEKDYYLRVGFGAGPEQPQIKFGTVFGIIAGEFGDGDDLLSLVGEEFGELAVRNAVSVNMGEGDDRAYGALGNDTIRGGEGDDILYGGAGADDLDGGPGNDVIEPGTGGADTIDGGVGDDNDRLTYRNATSMVVLDLATVDVSGKGKHGGAAKGDVIFGIKQFEGSKFDDSITGSGKDEVLEGLDGNDYLDGGDGADFLAGGAGADILDGGKGAIDVASYAESPAGVNISLDNILSASGGKGGHAEGDRLVRIERLIGSQHSDTLVGSPGANRIDGGRAGENYIDVNRNHKWDAGEKYIDANKNGQFDEGESFTDANKNGQFDAGEEYIDANNNKKWDSGFDSMVGGKGNDTYVVDDAADRVVEDTDGGIDLVESSVPYTLPANVEQLILTGIVEKDPAPAPVTKKAVAPNSGLGGITVIANPSLLFGANTGPLLALLRESLFDLNGTGNALDNAVVGNNGDNLLEGREGKDTLVGNDGNDYLNGGKGADRMVGGKGNDTFIVDDAAADVIIESPGSGTDAVHTSVTYTLPNHVENLTLTGPGTPISIAELHSGTGNALDNVITGNAGDNDIKGMAGNDTLLGRGGKDFLWGSTGNDSLDGGAGFDAMSGGAGNDTYVVDHALDKVTEFFGEGADEIVSSLSWDLPDHVENLTLTGTAALNGKGNSLANRLTGNAAANVLSGLAGNDTLAGGAGADTLAGGAGDDLYFLNNSSALLIEAANEGTDTVRSLLTHTLGANFENLELAGEFFSGSPWGSDLSPAINGTGNELANRITGNSAANRLDGGAGADTLVGGSGNDTYIVDQGPQVLGGFLVAGTGDIVDESFGGGTDTVRSSVNYSLGANVENLELVGPGAIEGRGNALANRLTGNEVANLLGGGAGNDTMTGGGGDDTYVVDAAADVVVEAANEGADVVWSSAADFTLPANVENLSLTGAGALRGTGNALANRIVGNDKNNVLDGGAAGSTGSGLTLMFFDGVDTLDGGAGADTMSGGYDDDTYIVDDPGDVVVEANLFLGVGGIDTVRSSVSFTLPARVENLALTGTASHGTGNGSSNVLTGNAEGNTLLGLAGNDLLEAQGGNDTLTGCEQSSGGGRGQVDTLTGGSGNDVFVLGVRVGGTLLGSSIMFYGDGNTSSPGQGDYALITDFLATRDKLQLAGAAKDYYLGVSGVSGVDGQGLWARGTSAGSSDELIAIIRSANSAALTATNTLNTATYV